MSIFPHMPGNRRQPQPEGTTEPLALILARLDALERPTAPKRSPAFLRLMRYAWKQRERRRAAEAALTEALISAQMANEVAFSGLLGAATMTGDRDGR